MSDVKLGLAETSNKLCKEMSDFLYIENVDHMARISAVAKLVIEICEDKYDFIAFQNMTLKMFMETITK